MYLPWSLWSKEDLIPIDLTGSNSRLGELRVQGASSFLGQQTRPREKALSG